MWTVFIARDQNKNIYIEASYDDAISFLKKLYGPDAIKNGSVHYSIDLFEEHYQYVTIPQMNSLKKVTKYVRNADDDDTPIKSIVFTFKKQKKRVPKQLKFQSFKKFQEQCYLRIYYKKYVDAILECSN